MKILKYVFIMKLGLVNSLFGIFPDQSKITEATKHQSQQQSCNKLIKDNVMVRNKNDINKLVDKIDKKLSVKINESILQQYLEKYGYELKNDEEVLISIENLIKEFNVVFNKAQVEVQEKLNFYISINYEEKTIEAFSNILDTIKKDITFDDYIMMLLNLTKEQYINRSPLGFLPLYMCNFAIDKCKQKIEKKMRIAAYVGIGSAIVGIASLISWLMLVYGPRGTY